MNENGGNFLSSRKRLIKKKLVSHIIEAMPTPGAWGVNERNAKGRGNLRILNGSIYFVKYDLPVITRSFEEQEEDVPDVDLNALDPANHTIGEDRRRKVHEHEDGVDLYALEHQIKRKLSNSEKGVLDTRDDIDGIEESREFIDADYNNVRDAERLRFELSEKRKKHTFALFELGAVTLLLAMVELLPAFGINIPIFCLQQYFPLTYLLLTFAGLAFAAYVSFEDIKTGVKNLLKRKLCARSITAIAIFAEALHIIYMLISLLTTGDGVSNSFAAPLCLALWIYTFNRTMVIVRVARGFNFVTKRTIRSALMFADDSPMAEDLRIAAKGTNAKISYVVRTSSLSSYFENAFREDNSRFFMKKMYPICLIASVTALLISSIRTIVMGDGSVVSIGFSTLCASLTSTIPITGMLCMEIPLSMAVKRLLHSGALLNGWNAVEKFGDTDALALNTTDLFPSGSVKIRKAVAVDQNMTIQEVTSLVAAVVMSAGGTLGELFGELVEKERKFTGNPDTITYESEMGISGWVNEKRILVGNRSMMEEHKVIVPNGGLVRLDEFENMKTRVGHQVLYVAVNNRLVGVYLMEYKAANNIRNALIRLISDGTNIMIYTCDANINVQLITDIFDIPARYISILDNDGSRLYDSLTYAVKEEEEALLVTNGSLSSLSAAIRAAVRLRENQNLGMMLQSVCFGMGFLLVAGLSCFSAYAIDSAQILIMQMVFVVISLVSVIRSIQ